MSGDNFSLPVDRFDGLLLDTYVVIGSTGVNHSRIYTGDIMSYQNTGGIGYYLFTGRNGSHMYKGVFGSDLYTDGIGSNPNIIKW